MPMIHEKYSTSNIKFLSALLREFDNSKFTTPFDFLNENHQKLDQFGPSLKSWVEATFTGICRYRSLIHFALKVDVFKRILTTNSIYYAEVLFYGLLFDLPVETEKYVYQTALDLNPNMAYNIFFDHLTSISHLSNISIFTCKLYSPAFVETYIIKPLLNWQPLLKDMFIKYEQFLEKVAEEQKIPVTVGKDFISNIKKKVKDVKQEDIKSEESLLRKNEVKEDTPKKTMLTKEKIDKILQRKQKLNREKANDLFFEANTLNKHFMLPKSNKYYETIEKIQTEKEHDLKPFHSSLQIPEFPEVEIKENKAQVKRLQHALQKIEKKEMDFFYQINNSCRNIGAYDITIKEVIEMKAIEEAKDIERKRILGQVAYEKAILAKEKVREHKKEIYQETVNEKKYWESVIDKIKKEEQERIKRITDNACLSELQLKVTQHQLLEGKKSSVRDMKKKQKEALEKVLAENEQEFQQRINMVKQIRALEALRKEAVLPKVIDLTVTGGFGFLNEMSIAELKERLDEMKFLYKKDLEDKQTALREAKTQERAEYEAVLYSVNERIAERHELRQIEKEKKRKATAVIPTTYCEETERLKKILEEKRALRKKIQAANKSKLSLQKSVSKSKSEIVSQ